MNVLINSNLPYSPQEIEQEITERITFGDKVAVSIVGLFTVSALLIGGWAGMLLYTGNMDKGGPLRHVVAVMQSIGIM